MSKIRVEMSVVRYFDVRDDFEAEDAANVLDCGYDDPQWFLGGVSRSEISWNLENV